MSNSQYVYAGQLEDTVKYILHHLRRQFFFFFPLAYSYNNIFCCTLEALDLKTAAPLLESACL